MAVVEVAMAAEVAVAAVEVTRLEEAVAVVVVDGIDEAGHGMPRRRER